MISVTKSFTFEAAHRLLGHEGKCKHLHGHSYKVEITVTSEKLDSLGRIVDFSIIKDTVGKWIAEELDHNIILIYNDPLVLFLLSTDERMPYRLACHPTTENLACVILAKAQLLLPNHLTVFKVRLWETATGYAEATNDPS